jgi:hypothetical protein
MTNIYIYTASWLVDIVLQLKWLGKNSNCVFSVSFSNDRIQVMWKQTGKRHALTRPQQQDACYILYNTISLSFLGHPQDLGSCLIIPGAWNLYIFIYGRQVCAASKINIWNVWRTTSATLLACIWEVQYHVLCFTHQRTSRSKSIIP